MSRIIKLTTLVLLPFVLLEAGLRIAGIGGSIVYEENPVYGYRPAPSQRFSTLGRTVTIDANGFRGPVSESSILCVGDSVTYGCAFVEDRETFAAHLGAVNAGVNGWGIQNVARFLQAWDLQPYDQVIWTIPTADFLRPFTTLQKGLISTTRPMFLRLEYLFRFFWYAFLKQQEDLRSPGHLEPNLLAMKTTATLLADAEVRLALVFFPFEDELTGQTVMESPYRERVLEAARQTNARIVLPAPPLNQELYRDSVHLSPAGHAWMADELRSRLGLEGEHLQLEEDIPGRQ
jgi:hypothetical protein